MFRRMSFIVVAALALGVACGSVSPGVAKQPPSLAATVLASRPLDSIPAGALFVNYLDLPQAAGASIKHKHGAGFVYAVQGAHEMDVDGVGPVTIQPGKAAFIGANVVHAHINPGTTGNDWWRAHPEPTTWPSC